MRILVVDDHQDIARMMRILLQSQGYEVKLAYCGQEALEKAGEFRPEVVLLDLTLPDLSGAAVAEELRRTPGFEQTTLVAISGYGQERTPPVFDQHFVKPVDHDTLKRFLDRLSNRDLAPGTDSTAARSETLE
jgi:CheY-like chemotaxis protein